MPIGHDTFDARIHRIMSGTQMIGEGLGNAKPARRRAARRARGGKGRGLLAMLVVCGGFGGAYHFGQLPDQMNAHIAAWGSQVQVAVLDAIDPATAQAGALIGLALTAPTG